MCSLNVDVSVGDGSASSLLYWIVQCQFSINLTIPVTVLAVWQRRSRELPFSEPHFLQNSRFSLPIREHMQYLEGVFFQTSGKTEESQQLLSKHVKISHYAAVD